MNLIVDFGNTLVKVALFRDKDLLSLKAYERNDPELQAFIASCDYRQALISSVNEPVELLKKTFNLHQAINISENTRLPIKNNYSTPASLGNDRLAAAVACNALFPGKTVLSIDAGTCIKLDLVHENSYLGGSIAPGLRMRLKAMHEFTGRLPLLELEPEAPLTGSSTKESMLSGVINGALSEIDGMINRYHEKYPELKVVITGGDISYFEKGLKNTTFAEPNLVLKGLNEILLYNAGL